MTTGEQTDMTTEGRLTYTKAKQKQIIIKNYRDTDTKTGERETKTDRRENWTRRDRHEN